MEKDRRSTIALPPLEGATEAQEENVRAGGNVGSFKRVRIAAGKQRQTSDRTPPPPTTRHVNIGEVVHPFKVTSGVVDSEELYREVFRGPINNTTSAAALLPQDLYWSLIRQLPTLSIPGRNEALLSRKKSTLQVPKPLCLMKNCVYPRKLVEKPPVYRIPSSEDLSKGYDRKRSSKSKKKKKETSEKVLVPDSSDSPKDDTTTMATESVKKSVDEEADL